jgi:hypothetical protein
MRHAGGWRANDGGEMHEVTAAQGRGHLSLGNFTTQRIPHTAFQPFQSVASLFDKLVVDLNTMAASLQHM